MKKLRLILAMIKFEHTIFALPFAYLGMVLAANGLPDFYTFFWITTAMVGARSYAMAVNRLADRTIDSRNPRTQRWPLSQGAVTVLETGVFVICSVLLFVISAFMLPSLCHKLWPLVLIPMTVYPFMKRFTWTSHLVLGSVSGLRRWERGSRLPTRFPLRGSRRWGLRSGCGPRGLISSTAARIMVLTCRRGSIQFPCASALARRSLLPGFCMRRPWCCWCLWA